MSADHFEAMIEAGLPDGCRFDPNRSMGAVKINAGQLRQLGCLVAPTPVEGNPFHVSVWLPKERPKWVRSEICRRAAWVVRRPDVEEVA
jgi:hypothetical protein